MNLTKEELRIGNYVSSPRGIERVSAIGRPIDVMFSDNTGYQLKYLSPIPLTEELLLRLGFEANEPAFEKGNFDIRNYGDYWVEQGLQLQGLSPAIKYLHQLQNIFYFLSGEELTLKD